MERVRSVLRYGLTFSDYLKLLMNAAMTLFNESFNENSVAVPQSSLERIKRRRFLQMMSTGAGALALGTTAGQTALAQSTRGIEGQLAPEISLDYWIDADGKPGGFSVEQSRGKWVFLKCFQNWCPGCHSSGFPTLKAFSDRFHDHPKVAIAGIQTVFEGYRSNTQDAVRELQLRYELPITMGHDPGDEKTRAMPMTMSRYRTGGTPWLILIDPSGRVVFNAFHVDPDKLINFIAEQVA